MLTRFSGYLEPIMAGFLGFPAVAALFTVPFMVVNYRKYGGIALMRVIVVYSFILYSLCAFLLTVMPLPARAAVAAAAPKPILWVPLTDLTEGMLHAGFDFSSLTTLGDLTLWRKYLTSRDFFQIAANIVMQVPLGFYLRYYFRCSFKKTVLIGLLVSLFYEVTQLTGLWFIYPHAYRFASTDDLINNTLGAALGYAVTPLLAMMLPSREEIDRISYRKGENLTLLRRMLAAVLDAAFLALLAVPAHLTDRITAIPGGVLFLIYFVLIPRVTGGRTTGQALLKLRIVQQGSRKHPTLWQLLVRNVLLYIAEPLLALIGLLALFGIVLVLTAPGIDLTAALLLIAGGTALLLGVVWFFLQSQVRWNTFPHGRFSRTVCVKEKEIAS